MNKIEERFYDELSNVVIHPSRYFDESISRVYMFEIGKLECQKPIGIYIVDFLIADRYIIEIDGHEAHKTKEQRYSDCKRERFLQESGYYIIRYTGSEVYVDALECAKNAILIVTADIQRDNDLCVDIYNSTINHLEKKGVIK